MKITDALRSSGYIYNHFVLPMSLFIGLTFRFPNRKASSEQFSAVLPLHLQKDKWEKNNRRRYVTVKTYEHHNTCTIILKNIKMIEQ